MQNLSTFQLGMLIGFALVAVVGVAFFALNRSSTSDSVGAVVIWGTLPQDAVDAVINLLKEGDHRFDQISYIEKDARTYEDDFVNALAAGRSPDIILLLESDIVAQADKLIPIPFDSYSERAFKDAFVEAGEVYLTGQGAIGLPFSIDPLVVYWNRDIFADLSISEPPRYWDEFFTLAPRVTKRNQQSSIIESLVAFGEYRNVMHAKDIIAALILQTGNPLIARGENDRLDVVFSEPFDYVTPPTEAALRFYTEFSNPAKAVYSWNRALPDSRQSFLAGDLALYFGFASEFSRLKAANPNLNFDVMALPQSRDAARHVTLAHMTALAISRGSSNVAGAFQAAVALTSSAAAANLAAATGLPPSRRDLLSKEPSDATGAVFYRSAVSSRAWLDPDPKATEGIFQRLVENTTSGRLRLEQAVLDADKELGQLLGN